MKKQLYYAISFAALLAVGGCATDGKIHRSEAEADPFESVNRPIFKFNYQVDKYVLKPLAQGYRKITNPFVRERFSSAFANLKEPASAVSNLLQGEPKASGINLSRLVINTTLGLGGTFDVAEGWGLSPHKTTFNATMAKWCIKDGPYIVLPIIGPNTPRSTVGMMVDATLDPVYIATYNDANIRDKVMYSYTAVKGITLRESALDLLDDLERNSVDYYAATRSAYLQNQGKLKCYSDKSSNESNYDFDFGLEEEDAAFNEMEE